MKEKVGQECGVCADHQRRTCIVVGRSTSDVRFIRLCVETGLEVSVAPVKTFDQEFQPMVGYPAERAARLYASYSRQLGATKEALDALGRFTTITNEEVEMATAKKAARNKTPGVKPAAKRKSTHAAKRKSTHAAKPKGEKASAAPRAPTAKKTGDKTPKPSAAGRFQELIREGKLADDEIFSAVQKEFDLDDKKRSYVAWYRNFLKKRGEKVPDSK